NLISGNVYGVVMGRTPVYATRIVGNVIGLNVFRSAVLPNAVGVGIGYGSSDNVVQSNVIAGNNGTALLVGADSLAPGSSPAAARNTIRQNTIYRNGGLGIDLGNDGPGFSRGAAEPAYNNLQVAPTLDQAFAGATATSVTGSLAPTGS